VDSSAVNSMVDLVFDHNALQRFSPRAGMEPAESLAATDERVPAGPLGWQTLGWLGRRNGSSRWR
jgi:hypothetical protein